MITLYYTKNMTTGSFIGEKTAHWVTTIQLPSDLGNNRYFILTQASYVHHTFNKQSMVS